MKLPLKITLRGKKWGLLWLSFKIAEISQHSIDVNLMTEEGIFAWHTFRSFVFLIQLEEFELLSK